MHEVDQLPAGRKRRWLRGILVALAVVGVLAVGGAGLAYAAKAESQQGDRVVFGGPRGRALHSQAVVPDDRGGYRNVYRQRGQVVAANKTSITVKSDDGYVRTYAVTGDTRVAGGDAGKLTPGTKVAVAGIGTDENRTATRISDTNPSRYRQ